MGDWDDDDWEAPSVGGKGEAEEWSDEEGHEAHKEETPAIIERQPKKPEKPKEKTLLELKIEEREAREKEVAATMPAQPAEVGAAFDDIGELEEPAAPAAGKQGLRNFDDDLDEFKADAPPVQTTDRAARLPSSDGFVPKTDADFETLAKMMYQQLAPYEGKKGFTTALKSLLRSASSNMSTDDCKELSSFVSVLSNDKIKADREKDQKGKKKKVKGKLNIAAGKDVDADGGGGGGGRGFHDDNDDFEW